MTAKVILNPYAGRWQALKRREEAEAVLHAAGINYELVLTERPNHGTALAAEAVRQGFSPIIAAGGDGSISEVVNGIFQAAESLNGNPMPPLGILPLGSANDLVDNLRLPKGLEAAAVLIASGQTSQMDLGMVNGRYFDNNAAIGLEPYITMKQQKITALKGSLRYLAATLQGVMDNPFWKMKLEWEGGGYEGPITLVTVGNNPRTGGLFYVTPHADPFDGLLTIVHGYLPTRRQILTVLPMIMKPGPGNYVEHSAVHEVHSPWLKVISETPTPLHADGEIQSTGIKEITFSIAPRRIPILMEPTAG